VENSDRKGQNISQKGIEDPLGSIYFLMIFS